MDVIKAGGSGKPVLGDFVDIIKEQKHQYDTCFSLKLWRPYPALSPEKTKFITEKIIQTPRMRDTILQVH